MHWRWRWRRIALLWDRGEWRLLGPSDVVVAAAPPGVDVAVMHLFLFLILFLFLLNGSRMLRRRFCRELVRRDLRHADGALHLRRGRGELW
jgi:hypothetical protein